MHAMVFLIAFFFPFHESHVPITVFIYCMLFYSLYVQLLSSSFTVICAVYFVYLFRLDALALSVIATATWLAGWLGGWLAGCLSHSGIVSKPLNPSENFFDHLKAPSL